jgi:hypothetical protein
MGLSVVAIGQESKHIIVEQVMRQRFSRKRRDVRGGKSTSDRLGLAEQLESRSMLSGIGIAVMPPVAPAHTDSPVLIAPPPAAGSGDAWKPPVTLPVIRASLRITMPAEVRAGVPTTVTAIAVDAAGRPRTSLNGSASVTSSDPAAKFPLIPVAFRNGRASFQVTFATAGNQSITVRSLDDSRLAATARTQVTAAPVATRFAMTLPRAVAVGVPVTVTITAVDAAGRRMPSHRGTATLTSTDPAAKLPTTVTFVNGRATVRVTFATTGEQTLSVSQLSAPNGSIVAIVGSATTQVGEVVTLGGSGSIVKR